jgi:hypothetical protein
MAKVEELTVRNPEQSYLGKRTPPSRLDDYPGSVTDSKLLKVEDASVKMEY